MITVYRDFFEINKLQTDVMVFIQEWVHCQKTPVPQKEIVDRMKESGIKEPATVYALNTLISKGYLRRAFVISNKTYYVQLRRV